MLRIGRPPLDDDFDSYSTPKISYVESAVQSIETHVDPSSVYDDSSHDPMSRPSSILEQSMEVSMTSDNDETAPTLQPKIERPDTPASVKDYYDDNEYNPQSPMDEATDTSITTQVALSTRHIQFCFLRMQKSLSHL